MSDFATASLPLLRSLPVPLAAILMQQVARYDRMFPREQRELAATLHALEPPRSPQFQRAVEGFAALRLSPELATAGWEAQPTVWTEQITAEMWSTGQIGALRAAATLVVPPPAADDKGSMPRAIVVVYDERLRPGSGSPELFGRLRAVGTHYRNVDIANHQAVLRDWLHRRVSQSAEPYAHWWISGDEVTTSPAVTVLSYGALRPARQHLLGMMNEARRAEGSGGPEGLRSAMHSMTPQQMGLPATTDPILSNFATDVLVDGSGTQLYSTTFVQWSAREALRRAQPRTLVARFTPRNASTSMDLRLSQPNVEPPLDGPGSLVDAEMAAHLTFVNLQRLPGAERAHLLVWHPGYREAMLIGSGVAVGVQSPTRVPLESLLQQLA